MATRQIYSNEINAILFKLYNENVTKRTNTVFHLHSSSVLKSAHVSNMFYTFDDVLYVHEMGFM